MMSKFLNTDQQIEKLNFLEQLAEGRHAPELLDKLGSIVIYNGLVEFYAVQAARLFEQGILKSQLHNQKKPSFEPHEDSWFYDKRISTRKIVDEIEKFLPFKDEKTGQRYDKEVRDFLKATDDFLDYRNSLIHRLGSPKTDLEDIEHCCDKLIEIYKQVAENHRIMSETLQPYRFSEKEIDFF